MIATAPRPAARQLDPTPYLWWAVLAPLLATGCGESATDPEGAAPDVALGRAQFVQSCAPCHASRDGFDLAFFGFTDGDIRRRAAPHVDETTAENILAYIRSLGVAHRPERQAFLAFQPGDEVVASDDELWEALFAGAGSSEEITARLRTVDLRTMEIPFAFPQWSIEQDDSDWLPDRALPPEIEAAVRPDLDAYYQTRSVVDLTAVIARFREVSSRTGAVCEGSVNSHVHPVRCFDARRWFSSLAAQHALRTGDPVPLEAVRVWWETGEAAVTIRFKTERSSSDPVAIGNPARWAYLAFSFAPAEFPAPAGYLTQHLARFGFRRTATLAAMIRMVIDGPMHEDDPAQRFKEAFVAVFRATGTDMLDVAEYVLTYLRDGLEGGDIPVPTGEALDRAEEHTVKLFDDLFRESRSDEAAMHPARLQTIEALRDEVLAFLGS